MGNKMDEMSGTEPKTKKSPGKETHQKGKKCPNFRKPLVTVITVSYNSRNTIRDTIESVLHQTYPFVEYLIIDGLSTDGTVEIAESYREAFARRGFSYRIVSEKDEGIYQAMNKGVSMAKGDLIGLLNSDDWYEENAAACAAAVYRKTHYDMMYANLRMVKRDGTVFIKKSRYRKHYITTREWNHPTTFITREMYGIYQYACKGNADDLDLMLRIRKDGRKVVVVPKVLANYRLGGSSNQKQPKVVWKRFLSKYGAYRDNGYSRWYLLECILMEGGKLFLA